jgi:large subunit ribosomal protein L15
LHPSLGARKKRKRVGRGTGSGHGKTSCRGTKGQKARSGRKPRRGFEGGQTPLARRLPKRGFKTVKIKLTPVNVEAFNRFKEGEEITEELLVKEGIIKKGEIPKILGKGRLSVSLIVKIPKVSEGALKKIEAAGGKVMQSA